MLAIVGVFAFNANALTFYVTVDNPENVSFSKQWVQTPLEAGRNTITHPSGYCTIEIKAADGATILSITKNGTDIGTSVSYHAVAEGDEFVITTQGATPVEKKRFMVNVTDHPELVWIIKNNDFMSANLKDPASSTQEIEFEDSFNPLSIKYYWKDDKNLSGLIYEVKVGDEPLTPESNGTFKYTAQDGDVVTITVDAPAETRYPVHFNLSESAAGFITGVAVDGEPATNWADADFDVKAESEVTIICDTENFLVESFKINGGTASLSNGRHTFTARQETTVDVNARHYYDWTVTLNIDHPELVNAFLGSSVNGEPIAGLQATNSLTVNERRPSITIAPKYGSEIASVTYNGSEIEPLGDAYTIAVTADGTIEVTAALIERNFKATVYVSDINYVYDIMFNRNNVAQSDMRALETGYQWLNFYEKDNPHMLTFTPGPTDYYVVKRNYEEIERPELSGDGKYNYSIELADNDLIQIYLGHTPIEYNVKFDLQGKFNNLKVTRDYTFDFDPLTATDEAVTVPFETAFTITADEPVTIKTNGTTVAEDTGSATLLVGNKDENKDFLISVIGAITDGINSIAGTDSNSGVRYYNLQGIRLGGEPTSAGIYIRQSAGRTEKIAVK